MELETVVENIMRLRSVIHEQNIWDDPIALSDLMVKLEVYNNYLSDHVAPLHKVATDTAFQKFREHESLGATKAQEYSRGESTESRETYEKAKLLNHATDNLVSRLQSRLRVIENQIKGR